MVALLLLLGAANAPATPIRPNIRKLVDQPQQDSTAQYIPARAGWDGPEMPQQAHTKPGLDVIRGVGLASAGRAELIAAATPDPRIVVGIMAFIVLLRLLRQREEKRADKTASGPPVEDEHRMAA